MLSVSDQLAIYEEIHALYGLMVKAAQANDWDSLVAAESRVALLRDRLMSEGGDVALSVSESERISAMIRNILEHDAGIRCHIKPWMDNVRQFLGSQRQRRQMQQAYAGAAGSEFSAVTEITSGANGDANGAANGDANMGISFG